MSLPVMAHRAPETGRHGYYHPAAPKASQAADNTMRMVQGVPYYQFIPAPYSQYYGYYQPYQLVQQQNDAEAAVKKPTPPRLSPLIIPYQPSPRPVCVSQPGQKRPATQGYQHQRQSLPPRPHTQQRPQQFQQNEPRRPQHGQQAHQQRQPQAQEVQQPPAPQHPPPRPPKTTRVELQDNMDYFDFQYPCMLPPETITLAPASRRPVADARSDNHGEAARSPRYSLPVLPSESDAPVLQRSKPYLQSRRKRLGSTRGTVLRRLTRDELHGVAPPAPVGFSTTAAAAAAAASVAVGSGARIQDSEQWYDFVESGGSLGSLGGESTATPSPLTAVIQDGGRPKPETPLEYRAQQAAALHDLLGMVLGEDRKGEDDVLITPGRFGLGADDLVGILEEEIELAARGYRKVAADEYLRDVRDVWGCFESPL